LFVCPAAVVSKLPVSFQDSIENPMWLSLSCQRFLGGYRDGVLLALIMRMSSLMKHSLSRVLFLSHV